MKIHFMRKSKYFVRPKGRIHEKKVAVLLDCVQITSPQFGQLVQLFLNAKNVDLGDIQNDTLLKIQTIDQKGGNTPLTDTIC